MYEMGVDEKIIQEMMGHTTVLMTRHNDRRQAKEISAEYADEIFGYNDLKAAKNRAFLKVT